MAETALAPAPTPTPTPAPVADAKSTPPIKSISDDIDDMIAGEKLKAAPVKSPEPANSEAPKTLESVAPKPGEAKPPVKGSMAEFRLQHDEVKRERDNLKAELARTKSAKPAEDVDKPRLVESLTSAQKRIKELEEIVQFKAYEESDDFKTKYQKPYEESATNAQARAVQLKVPTGEGNSRNLTKDEFWSIVGIGDDDAALAAAEQLFGEGSSRAALVVNHRNEVLKAHYAAEKAKTEWRKNADERTKADGERAALEHTQSETHQKELATTFQGLIDQRIAEKPDYYKADEGDEVGQREVDSWKAVADLAFDRLTPEQTDILPDGIKNKLVNGQLPPSERVKLHASMYSALPERALALHKLGLAHAKITELQEALKAYEETEPENAGGQGHERPVGELSAEDEFRAAEAANR